MKRKWKILRQHFIDLSLKNKLILFFASLMLFVTIIVLGSTYKIVIDEYKRTILRSADLSFSQAHDFTVQTILPMINASDTIYYNSVIQEILQDAKSDANKEIAQQMWQMRQMQDILFPQNKEEQGISVRLYVDDTYVFSNQDVYFSRLSEIMPEFGKRDESEKEQYFWIAPQKLALHPNQEPAQVVSLCRRVRNLENYQEMLGAIRVSIEAERLTEILRKANITQEGIVFIINSQGEVIAASNEELLMGLDWENLHLLKAEPEEDWKSLSCNAQSYIMKCARIDKTDWTFAALIPEHEIRQPGHRIAMMIGLIMLGAVFFAGIYVVLFSGWFAKRMRFLARQMLTVQSGNLNISIENKDADEIGMLYESFNYMLNKIKELMQEQYEIGKEIKSAELKALQAQINPHFLYNTLDLINWKALKSNAMDVAQIAQKLAKFYKLSLKGGEDIVTLRDEIRHVNVYVEVQSFRFDNRILLSADVEESLQECLIPKIILQPLVENSIIHGILCMPGHSAGRISITAEEKEGDIILKVEDNGVGMTKQQLKDIWKPSEKDGQGYGVKNIDMRLKLYYGREYGLSYWSMPKKGTVVTVRIAKKIYGK